MRRVTILVTMLTAPALLVAGCSSSTRSAGADVQPRASTRAKTAASSGTATPRQSESAATNAWVPDDGPSGVLAALYTKHYSDHDRVVFQFYGRQAPTAAVAYADRITEDPSDKPVPLIGKKFVGVVFHGGRLSTAAL